ncbi:MAG: gliding motility-associated C-terminal domain-containing protein [Bacteroidales bacterium]|nr:gliding motility-associated C-terminal domain-containing protein [Bacteroidales bacterium]
MDSKDKYSFSIYNGVNNELSPFPAPQDGDYQTRATGSWGASTTWQVRVSGEWANCAPGDYPGVAAGAGDVFINNGHSVTLNVSPANPVKNVIFQDGTTTATTLNLSGRTLNVTGNVILGSPASDAGDQTISLGNGTLNCASIFMPSTEDPTYDVVITATSGTINVTGNIRMEGTSDINNITFTGAATINVGGDFTGGGFTCSTGRINYNGTNQKAGGYTYYNLNISGGGTKSLAGAATVTGTLTLSSGLLRLGDYDLTLTNTTAIAGAPFSSTNMIETNGTGRFIRSANASNQSFNRTYPVGSNGFYNPLVITNLPNITAADRSISLRAVPEPAGSFPNYINKHWDISVSNITTGAATRLSFAYDAAEAVGNPADFQLYTNTSGTWNLATGASAKGVNPATSTGSATITGLWTTGAPGTFYSYQTGNWDQASTWTFDPSGTTGPGTMVPGIGDKVVILSGRTVFLSGNVTTQNLDVTINSGGILDLSVYSFTNGLTALRGAGTLKLSSASFPSPVTTNTFVTTDGGITEYTAAITMPVYQTVYYHLSIRAPGQVVQINNLTLNGNLLVRQGTYQINDATAQRLSLIINGDVVVDNGAAIRVGTGVTNTQTSPLEITGTTGGFINYYELHSHRIQIYGNFTNNGTVRFTNLSYPVYNSFPPIVNGSTTGFATVYFNGSSDKTLTCNGQTDFYNLVLDKGIDQTFKLVVYSTSYSNFRLFGANIAPSDATAPATNANPNLKKALWVRAGTLVLQGLVVIPSLTEGTTAGPPSSDFYIPGRSAVILDGAGVIVMSTADDYREVNGAYSVTAPDNASMGIDIGTGNSGISVSGKLQLNNGYLSTRESTGIIYWNYAPGQFILNGGTVDTKQFHSSPQANSLISYSQTGGTMILRGRFKRTTTTYTPEGLVNSSLDNSRASGGIDASAGSFDITNSGGANGFSMTGGTIKVYDVCGNTSPTFAYRIACSASDINVTGGIVEIIPTSGTVPAEDVDYFINTTAPFANLTINRASGTTKVQLNSNPVTVLKNLIVSSGELIANNLDVTIGGDFTIASGSTYTPGNNITTFNGTTIQNFNVYAAQTLYRLTINKPSGVELNFGGTSGITISVLNEFRLLLGTLNDNGNTINIARNVYNSGTIAGAGKIVLNGTQTQTIDGNGVFGNVELNNNNAAVAPVSLLANMTVNGTLKFSRDKLFNIGTYNLRLNGQSSIVNAGALRYIQCAGNNGDGGVTKVFSTSEPFTFHLGMANYTPATYTFNTDPSSYGSITVVPVNYAHPNVTTAGRSLTYYWKVTSAGFTLGSATVTHGYTYAEANVVTGGTVTENEYVAARFNNSTSSWTKGTAADVDETLNIIGEPGSGIFLENVSFIDGDYTAGDDNPVDPFGSPKVFYSRQSGLWTNVNTWSLTGHTVDNPPSFAPGANDIVIIGGNDSVYLATDPNVPNTGSVSCATLQIEAGSALDVGFNPSSVFSRVVSHPNGNGNFRLTTNYTSPSTYAFPSGDFSDYNVNRGTTELYTTNPGAGTTYYLPSNVSSYGNLILSPLGGSNVIFGNLSVTIYGDLITRGQNADSWFLPSWGTTYPGSIATVPKTITVKGNMDIQGGSLIWYQNGTIAQNFVVEGDVKVATLSALYIWSGATNQSMSIGGSLINNTDGLTHGLTTTSKVDFTNIPVTFFGSNPASVTNTAGNPTTVFSTVTVNKGNSQDVTLTIDIAGTLTTPANNWLTLQNGTLRYMRTDPSTDFTISTTTPFIIPATAGLYVNLPSNSGNRNILIGNAANNNGDLLLNGKLTIVNSNVYVGRTGGTDANNNDIEYSSSGASAIEISGGLLRVNGQIRRNPSNAAGVLTYNQSGGTVIINGRAFITTNAKFEVVNDGSEFTMTGGTLTIVRGNGVSTTPSSPFGDLYLRPQAGSVTGGTIVFDNGNTATQNYFLDATIPLYNITITGYSGRTSTLRLLANPLTVNGNMLINSNSILNSNNINITFNGNFTNSPGATGYVSGTNLSTFSATTGSSYAGAQTLTGVTNFYDLVVAPGVSFTLNNTITVNRNLSILTGTLVGGANTVNVKGDFINNGSYTDNNSDGSGVILNGTSLQKVSGTGSFARLTLNNSAGANVDSDITLSENLTITNGILNIKSNLLTLGVNSNIQGDPFSASKLIVTNGVSGNGGLRKFFNTGANPSFTFPLGVSGKYTPAVLSITSNSTVGYVKVNNINEQHPGVTDPDNALDYYWSLQSSGLTNLSGNIVFSYLQEDVIGSQENNYLAARLEVPGTKWTRTPEVNPAINSITFNYSGTNNLGGEYTAGIFTAFPSNMPEYTSNSNGNWSDKTIWTQTGGDPYPCPDGGPNGFIVTIDHEVALDANYCTAYRTTLNSKLKVVNPYYGHSLGTVTGNGTLYLENGTFPSGIFTDFLSCSNNSTIEYGGTGTYTIIADLYDNIPKIHFTGGGTRVLPDKNLTVCKQFLIDGPTVDNSVYDRKLTIKGSMERYNTGTFISGSGSNATVSFEGTSAQTIGGITGNFSGTNSFNNLEINNPAGLTINTGGDIEVAGNLLLTNGLINTSSTGTLKLKNTSTNCVIPSGGSSSSYISGPLTKTINQYEEFLFPIGTVKAGLQYVLGNRIKVSSTQSGPVDWTAEYFSPNTTSSDITTPLVAASSQEYWNLKTISGSQSLISLGWTPSSDITPLVAGGLSNIRVAHYDSGTGKWMEVPTIATGDNYYGTAASSVLQIFNGSDNFTLASVSSLKPRAQFTPSGPVCGTTGIPVSFISPDPIPFNYILEYTINGVLQAPVTITSADIPYTLSTAVPGVYALTSLKYNGGTENGTVDATPVTTYAEPTTAMAGPDQAVCGITTAILAGNTPVLGTGLWSIVSGNGGTIITPSSPTSQFIGLNGNVYTLRWTISNGFCNSMDDVIINFVISPDAPAAPSLQNFCPGATIADLVATPPPACTVDWYDAPAGGTKLAPGTPLINNTTYYAESNGTGGCVSNTRTPVLTNVIDDTKPVITCSSDILQNIDAGVCTAMVNIPDATISDNCAIDALTWEMTGVTTASSPLTGINQIGSYIFNKGLTVVTYTLKDASGNQSQCLFNVTVKDNIPPVITLPVPPVINADAGCQASIPLISATFSDNCTAQGNIITSQVPAAGTIVGKGVTTVTITATDEDGNTANENIDVTVVDVTPPVIIPPVNPTLDLDASCETLVPDFLSALVVTDNCTAPASIIKTQNPAAGTAINGTGTTNVNVYATDLEGNESSVTVVITSRDVTPPVMSCKDINLYLDNTGSAILTPAMVDNGSTDNCTPVLSYILSKTNFSCSDIGAPVSVTLTGTDGSGNLSNCNALITVLDSVQPVVNVKTFTLVLGPDGTGTLLPSDVDNGSFDNCGTISLSVYPNTFSCSDQGKKTVTLTAVDVYGNSASKDVEIIITSSLTINSISLTNCILAEPFALYDSDVSGGNGDYSYLWDGLEDEVHPFVQIIPEWPFLIFSNTSTAKNPFFNNLMPNGIYHIQLVVTDGNGCKDTSVMTIDKSSLIFNNITERHTTACEGEIKTYSVNYDPDATYNWAIENGTIITTPLNTNEVEVQWNMGITQGVLIAMITMPNILGNPCESSVVDTVTISAIPLPEFDNPATNVCSNNEVTYTLTNTYTSYAWTVTGGETTGGGTSGDNWVKVRWGTEATGKVSVTVQNASSCYNTTFVDVIIYNLQGTVVSKSDVSCNGLSDGSVTVEATTGTGLPPYQYSLDGGAYQPNGTFNNIAPGNHFVRIQDKLLCTFDVPFTITQPTVLLASISSQTNISCYGGSDGSVTISASGGSSPYEFNINGEPFQPSNVFSGLTVGEYTVIVRDANLCTRSVLVNITQPTALSGVVSLQTNVDCNGNSTGSVTVTGLGGTPSYEFSLDGGPYQVSGNFTGLAAGGYNVTVRDANLCTFNVPVLITQPSVLTGVISSQTNVTCYGGNEGQVTIAAEGGTAPYQYSLNGGGYQVSSTFMGLSAGSYIVTVRDANLCTVNVPVTITEPAQLIATAGSNSPVCQTSTINLTGGPDGMASYEWTGPNGFTSSLQNPSIPGAIPTMGGVYYLTVTDANGCTAFASTNVTITPLNTIVLTSSLGTDNQTVCISTPITNITYSTTGATGATFTGLPTGVTGSWASDVVSISGTPTASGTFNYTVTLTGGCGNITKTGVIKVDPLNTITLTSAPGTVNQTVCIGTPITNITYSTTGATGATFSNLPSGVNGVWNSGVVTISGSPTASGTYNYAVTLTGGCGTATENGTITVTPNNTITLTSATGTDNQTVCINTPITNITYSTTGATGATFIGLPAGVTGSWASDVVTISGTPTASGTYNYAVTLTGGCGTATENGTITVTPNNTITLTSASGTNNQTVCIGTPITNITYSTTGATGATFSNLPSGVNGVWNSGVVTISGSPTASGTFNYTVTLTGGCGTATENGTITVTPNNTITLTSASGTNNQTVCIGTPITNITYSTTGATGATFSNLPSGVNGVWNSGVVTISGSPTASGTYNYTVTLTGGCGTATENGTITVTPNNTITLTSASGTDNQTVCISTPITNITYSTTGATGATFAGLPTGVTGSWASDVVSISGTPTASGTFNYTVTLTGGCGNITAPGVINVNPDNTVTLTSAAGTDNQTVCISTPITNITYSTTGATGATFAGLPAGVTGSWASDVLTISGSPTASGTFNYTVELIGGCGSISATGSITVNALPVLIVNDPSSVCSPSTVDITDPAVTAGSDPGLSITYWTDLAATIPYPTPTTATNGTYYIKGTDDITGCFDIKPVNVVVNTSPSGTASVTDVTCQGGSDGIVDLTVNTGTPPFLFLWSNGATSEDLSGVSAGTYNVIITDANNCTGFVSATVADGISSPLNVTVSVVNVLCYGDLTGALDITVTGGTAPYSFLWSNSEVSEDISGVPAGEYTVTVTDAIGCIAVATETVSQPDAPINIEMVVSNVRCFGETNGAVDITVTNGTAPYTFLWNNGAVTEDITDLSEGSYTVTVTDANGCTANKTETVNAPLAPLSANAVVTNVLCYGESTGAVDITVSGGTSPYSYLWSNGATTEDLNNVPVGSYTVIITDTNGCTFISGGNITGPESGMTASVSVSNVLCNGTNTGAIDLTVSGGAFPYTYLWSNGETTEDISSLPAGQYSVTITDLTGCSIVQDAWITEPEKISIVPTVVNASCPDTRDGSITLAITGGVAPYTVLWSDGITGTTRNAGDSTYTVIVTDVNACAEELDIEVSFTGTNCLEIPEVITPNGDGKNDTWIIRNIEMYPNAEVLVYNRWGKLIFKSKNPAANPWDGRYKGKLVPVDSYHYILYLNDGSNPRKGVITVIR